jgi:hypothetical protein
MDDHLLDFELRPGRIRNDGRQAAGRVGRLSRVVAKRAGGGTGRPTRAGGKARAPDAPGRCSRIGRGQDAANGLKRQAAQRHATGYRSRRVVVKGRIVGLKAGSKAAGAHLRYLVRDGVTRYRVTRDGEPARLYGADSDDVDGAAFTERGAGDRRQSRFIVAPEDGAELSDLGAYTRELMDQMEIDLGTRLDWVAVDHFNTAKLG